MRFSTLLTIGAGMWVWPIAVYVHTGDFILALAWMGIEVLGGAVLLVLYCIALRTFCMTLQAWRKH